MATPSAMQAENVVCILVICFLYPYTVYFHVFEFLQDGTDVVHMFQAWRG